jgi:hypothetical protein
MGIFARAFGAGENSERIGLFNSDEGFCRLLQVAVGIQQARHALDFAGGDIANGAPALTLALMRGGRDAAKVRRLDHAKTNARSVELGDHGGGCLFAHLRACFLDAGQKVSPGQARRARVARTRICRAGLGSTRFERTGLERAGLDGARLRQSGSIARCTIGCGG